MSTIEAQIEALAAPLVRTHEDHGLTHALARVLRHKLPAEADLIRNVLIFDEPLFRDARLAVRFAFTLEGAPKRPASSRMLDKSLGAGAGMENSVEKAAQAGIIQSVLRRLGDLQVSCLVASECPSTVACVCRRPCCSGVTMCTAFHDAIFKLAEAAVFIAEREGGFPLRRASYPARVAVLMKQFTRKLTLEEIATQVKLDEDTVGRYHRAVVRWLKGARAGKNGEPATEGLEQIAWREAESLLRAVGIVGS